MSSKKTKVIHRCRDCGFESHSWRGQCSGCQAWQTMVEVVSHPAVRASIGRRAGGGFASAGDRISRDGGEASLATLEANGAEAAEGLAATARPAGTRAAGRGAASEPRRRVGPSPDQLARRAEALDVSYLGEVSTAQATERIPTGLRELDRVLGGGLVPGAATILGGDPGVGKSTLVLQLAYALAAAGRRVLYVAGEESPAQLRLRAERLGFLPAAGERAPVMVLGDVDLGRVLEALDLAPDLVIVDSIQVVRSAALDAAPGTVSQVRDVAHALVEETRVRGASLLLVGHVTKEGTLAGPRVVEHLVDQVIALEGEAGSALRTLRSSKNRFGDSTETGVLEMTATGLVDVESPSVAFLKDRALGASGSCVLATREGSRSYLVEVQALCTERAFSVPTRRVTGLEAGRAVQVLAVLEKRGGLVLRDQDVFLNVTAGARVREPAADMAIAVACASSHLGRSVPDDTIVFGELGLAGELRAVPGGRARVLEAARLGFRRAVVPYSDEEIEVPEGFELLRVKRIEEVLQRLLR